ncbi:ATP-binding protein [Seohaeicola saemankumensis]|uniref:sensor histidine kinase n=1 Tax=Seohaeicola TaxID=481178 RepID=UPI0035CFD1F3
MRNLEKSEKIALSMIVIIGLSSFLLALNGRLQAQKEGILYQLIDNLSYEIGYSGLIHHFKNAVLRPNEPEYLARANTAGQNALDILDKIEHAAIDLGVLEGTTGLENTRAMIAEYTANIGVVSDAHAQGKSVQEVDDLVRVDDFPATQEISRFRQEVFSSMAAKRLNLNLAEAALCIMIAAFFVMYIIWTDNQRANLLKEKLRLTRQNIELKSFADEAAHELRTPIAQVVTASDLILEDAPDASGQDYQIVGMINRIANDMLNQVNSLLEYSRYSDKKVVKQNFSMRDLVRGIAADLSNARNKQHSIIVKDMPDVPANADLFKRVWSNLIQNSIKYTNQGAPAEVMIYGDTSGSDTRYFIEDRGIGIDPSRADDIFGYKVRLHEGDNDYDGYGIGLALVRSIINRHGGKIYLDKNYQTGARFCIVMPST